MQCKKQNRKVGSLSKKRNHELKPMKIRRKNIALEKCSNFISHPLAISLYKWSLNHRKQYDLSGKNEKHIRDILIQLPISVIETQKNTFCFFNAFESVALAVKYPHLKMRLDIFEDISDQNIQEKSWHSISTRFAFESHKDYGLADNFDLLKLCALTGLSGGVMTNRNLTEDNFAEFAGVSKKAVRNQRTETKRDNCLKLSISNIKGTRKI